jgi:hypothetical protein
VTELEDGLTAGPGTGIGFRHFLQRTLLPATSSGKTYFWPQWMQVQEIMTLPA